MRVTTKGQVTIPKEIRDHLGIVPGSEVEFLREADGVRFVAAGGQLTKAERMRAFEQSLDRMAGTIDTMGLDGKAYVDWLRGPREDLDVN